METLMPRHFRAVIKRTILPLDSEDAWDFFSQQLGESQGSADCCRLAVRTRRLRLIVAAGRLRGVRRLFAPCRGDDEDRHFYPIFLGPNDFLGVRETAAIAPAGLGVGAAADAVLARERFACANGRWLDNGTPSEPIMTVAAAIQVVSRCCRLKRKPSGQSGAEAADQPKSISIITAGAKRRRSRN